MPSSVVLWHRYDKKRKELLIVFVSGAKYIYAGVPPGIYQTFRRADSKGKYLNTHIKPNYSYTRLDGPLPQQKNKGKYR